MKGMIGVNPLRGMERSMNPEHAQYEMRDPGMSMAKAHLGGGPKPPRAGGLGSLHRTMPHLMRHSGMPHFDTGGLSNPAGQAAQANNRYVEPDAQYRSFLQAIGSPQVTNRSLMQAPSGAASFGYDAGGAVGQGGQPDDQQPDDQDVNQPDEDMSPGDQQEKQIVLNAMAALDGQSPDPEADLQAFIQAFGPQALSDLQKLVEQHHQEQGQGDGEEDDEDEEGGGSPSEPAQPGPSGEPGDDEDEEQQAAAAMSGSHAGGGLLHGRGTGQSDEIEASTPSGHPVLLSDGEYVIDAPTVAALGDGSTKAGARRLDEMRKQIRKSAYGHDKQAKPMKASGGGVVIRLK